MVFLNTPGSRDLITLNEEPNEAQMASVNGGVNHFGFRLAEGSDLDSAVAEVEAAGGTLVKLGEHTPGVLPNKRLHPPARAEARLRRIFAFSLRGPWVSRNVRRRCRRSSWNSPDKAGWGRPP